ncbi:hypothetical protein LX32DRAFT_70670 [Colletotrichum zoysiae]|uniref:Uncharacterized protein n=1 Tax=Colletotrichum zoysiae TaxID=1216348 RepID=A0AAD9HA89_9PEZI|nr:hypothetical protein LX32DRAFT_70670 [Colletotrichum zoysiae]
MSLCFVSFSSGVVSFLQVCWVFFSVLFLDPPPVICLSTLCETQVFIVPLPQRGCDAGRYFVQPASQPVLQTPLSHRSGPWKRRRYTSRSLCDGLSFKRCNIEGGTRQRDTGPRYRSFEPGLPGRRSQQAKAFFFFFVKVWPSGSLAIPAAPPKPFTSRSPRRAWRRPEPGKGSKQAATAR